MYWVVDVDALLNVKVVYSMAELCLASAGDDIKLWDGQDFSFIRAFNYHDGSVSSINWSADNLTLVSASERGDKVVLTYPDATGSSTFVSLADKVSRVYDEMLV